MNTKVLYKYTREDGGITVSLNKPECEYTELVRIIADDNKKITKDGENLYTVIDCKTTDAWYEVEAPEDLLIPEA